MSDAKEGKIIPMPPRRRASLAADGTGERGWLIESLYRDHWRDLCRRLRRVYGRGPPEPEDLAQSAFTKVIAQVDLQRIENPRAFLFRAAVNLGLNEIARIRRTRRFIEEELAHAGVELELEETTPSHVLESREALRSVENSLARLSAKQREILMRCRIKGETYAEISAATGWSQADISRQLNAALAAIHAALESDSGN